MTNLVITFVTPDTITLTPTGTINYQIDKINSDQSITTIIESTAIEIASNIVLSDGIYKITNISNSVAETVIIYNSIIEHLNANITDILLNGMPQSLYPNNYDFVLTEDNYTSILKQIHENIDENIGKTVKMSGFVFRMPDFKEKYFVF